MLKNAESRIAAALLSGVNRAVVVLKTEIDRLTPEDTRKLVGNNRVKPARQEGNAVIGAVVNDTEYAAYVEYGVKGRSARYHKPKGTVAHVGVGARMFARAFDSKKKEITATVANALKTALRNA